MAKSDGIDSWQSVFLNASEWGMTQRVENNSFILVTILGPLLCVIVLVFILALVPKHAIWRSQTIQHRFQIESGIQGHEIAS